MPSSRSVIARWMILCISIVLLACYVHPSASAPNIQFAIRIVDESGDAPSRSSGADLVANFKDGGSIWLKREGAIEGLLVLDAHVGTGGDGSAVVLFTLTPDAADRFAALTRANVGHRLAMVVNGKVVVNTLIAGEAPRTPLQFDGHFTTAEARAIAAEMMGASPTP
jgi:preprotein translocase subunit SecD